MPDAGLEGGSEISRCAKLLEIAGSGGWLRCIFTIWEPWNYFLFLWKDLPDGSTKK